MSQVQINEISGFEKDHDLSAIVEDLDGSSVRVAGYVERVRRAGKNLVFIILRDYGSTVQLTVVKGESEQESLILARSLSPESVVGAVGTVVKTDQTDRGIEIKVDSISLLSRAGVPLPLDMSAEVDTGLDTRLNWRCMDLRTPRSSAIMKVQAVLVKGMFNHLTSRDYVPVSTPAIMGVPSESGAEMFEVPYFETKAFLRQDPQLHRQLTIASGFDRIFDFGPSWRAEQSHTNRHLCEHRTFAVEQAFIKDEFEIMRAEEELVIAALETVRKECAELLELMGVQLEIPSAPFPVLQFPDVWDILEDLGMKDVARGEDLDTEGEKRLAAYVKEKHGTDWFFVNRFPFAVKPFYVMRVDDDPEWARSVDLVYKGVEQSSGGQREHRYPQLKKNVKEKKMRNVKWFTRFFEYGVPPHGGFAIGVERFTMQLLDVQNIREATLFPRDPDRLTP